MVSTSEQVLQDIGAIVTANASRGEISLLVMGCGKGQIVEHLNPAQIREVALVDPNENNLDRASVNFRNRGISARIICSDQTEPLGLRPHSFDLAIGLFFNIAPTDLTPVLMDYYLKATGKVVIGCIDPRSGRGEILGENPRPIEIKSNGRVARVLTDELFELQPNLLIANRDMSAIILKGRNLDSRETDQIPVSFSKTTIDNCQALIEAQDKIVVRRVRASCNNSRTTYIDAFYLGERIEL